MRVLPILIICGGLAAGVAFPALPFSAAGHASVPAPDFSEGLITKPKSRLRLFLGPAKVSRPFLVTAYVKNGDEQNCTLKLPACVKFAKDERPSKEVKTQTGKAYAVVAWRVIAEEEGEYTLEAVLDDGVKDKAATRVHQIVGTGFR